MDNIRNRLFELCSDCAPSGREDLLLSLERLVKPYADKTYRDNLGNLVAVKYSKYSGSEKLMIDAHADEIGLIVTGIDDNGFLHFANHTGIDDKILPSSTVTVLSKPNITGVIATLPPHLLKDADTEKTIKAKDMVIDIGLCADKAREIVKTGDLVALRSGCYDLLNGLVLGKSFDNRAGCAALVTLMKMLTKVNSRYDVYAVFSAAEEFGGYGATAAAFDIAPDKAIVLDATFGVSPYTNSQKARELGEGPVICASPMLDTHMKEAIIGIARSRSIPYQVEVERGRTGTNADNIVVSRNGVPTALVSIPLRYMHSAGEIVSVSDIENTVRILLSFAEQRGGVQ